MIRLVHSIGRPETLKLISFCSCFLGNMVCIQLCICSALLAESDVEFPESCFTKLPVEYNQFHNQLYGAKISFLFPKKIFSSRNHSSQSSSSSFPCPRVFEYLCSALPWLCKSCSLVQQCRTEGSSVLFCMNLKKDIPYWGH